MLYTSEMLFCDESSVPAMLQDNDKSVKHYIYISRTGMCFLLELDQTRVTE
jgi:hypothetical protein